MRKALFVGGTIVVLVGLFVAAWLFLGHKPTSQSSSAARATSPDQTKREAVSPPQEKREADFMKRRKEEVRSFLEAANVPIDFWGRVLDQDNKPLAGVSIELYTRIYNTMSKKFSEKNVPHTLQTDATGLFSVTGDRGDYLKIASIEKEGYVLSSKAMVGYSYHGTCDVFVPDRNNPVVFQMWKKGEPAARLVNGDNFYGIIPDGRVFTIDLSGKKKVEGAVDGDLRVWIKRPAQVAPMSRYDWSFEIEAVEGGVMEARDEFMYRAPESGYQPRYEMQMNASDDGWKATVEKQFYVKSRGGRVYTRMLVEVFSVYNDKAVFSVKYYSNPDGSRNLEYDGERTKLVSP